MEQHILVQRQLCFSSVQGRIHDFSMGEGGSTWVCSCLTLDASPVNPPPPYGYEKILLMLSMGHLSIQYGTSLYTGGGGGEGGIFYELLMALYFF